MTSIKSSHDTRPKEDKHDSDHRDRSESPPSNNTPSTTSQFTLHKLRDLLQAKRFTIKNLYTDGSVFRFIEIVSELTGEKLFIYIPSKYPIPYDGLSPHIAVSHYDPKRDKHSDSRDGEIDLSTDKATSMKKFVKQSKKQLYRLRKTTTNIPYKLGILNQQTLCYINRHNSFECYALKDAYYSSPENLIVIDLENFYANLTTVCDDVYKFYKNLFGILNKTHERKLDSFIRLLRDVKNKHSKLIIKYGEFQKYLSILDRTSACLDLINEEQSSVLRRYAAIYNHQGPTIDASRSFKLSHTEKELNNINELKSQTMELYREVKDKYVTGLFQFDKVVNDHEELMDEVLGGYNEVVK